LDIGSLCTVCEVHITTPVDISKRAAPQALIEKYIILILQISWIAERDGAGRWYEFAAMRFNFRGAFRYVDTN
jgi:hypothetical protein